MADDEVSVQAETMLDHALVYHRRGWSVVPIRKGAKVPTIRWQDYQDRQPSEAEIRTWFAHPTDHLGGMAVILGDVSGRLYVRDFDEAGMYEAWSDEWPEYASTMPTVKTARGAHVYGILPADSPLKGTIRQKGGELRGDGGIVLLPPSKHPSGAVYEWVVPCTDANLREIDPFEIGLGDAESATAGKKQKVSVAKPVEAGGRNDTLMRLGCSLRDKGSDSTEILAALLSVNEKKCRPPLEESEVQTIVNSVCKYVPTRDATKAANQFNRTEVGNAQRFARDYGHECRYVSPWKKWIVWDGTRWRIDETGTEVQTRMLAVIKSIFQEASDSSLDDKTREALAKWSIQSETNQRIRASLAIAAYDRDLAIMPDVLDANPWTINVLNGTLHLPRAKGQRAQLEPHCKSDMITKLIPIVYNPAAEAPTWEKFLGEIFCGDDDLYGFVQRSSGVLLTGSTRDHVLNILYGTGRNGKSTLVETLQTVLGEYSATGRIETFSSVKFTQVGANDDVAALKGSRFVVASESESTMKLREGLIKQLTGGDRVTARKLYQESFTFIPEFKLWFVCNHMPTVRNNDQGVWSRIRMIPFNYTIPENKIDPNLPEKLKGEIEGILSWVVEGVNLWAENNGVGYPDVIRNMTSEYRLSQNTVAAWLDEEVDVFEDGDPRFGTGLNIPSNVLFGAFKDWARENQEWCSSNKQFSQRLVEMGYRKERKNKGYVWLDMELKRK